MNSQNIQNKGKINFSLNFVKTIAIFAVICIHCGLFYIGNKGLVIDALSRFAVPIFLLTSGFYSHFDDQSKALNKYKTRLVKLIKLFILANLIYLVYDILTNKNILSVFLQAFDLNNIFNYIFLNVSPFGFHLWFILVLICCYILYFILTKFSINPNVLYRYVPILLIACLFIGEFSQRVGLIYPIEYYRNFLLMGLPFFTLGYYIHDKKEVLINNISNFSIVILAIFGFLLTILEVLVVGKSDLFTGTILFTVFVFLWCVKNPDKLNFKITELIGGKLYTSIYILHPLVMYVIVLNYGYFNPVVHFILTTVLSGVIYLITSKLNLNFI